MRCWTRSSPKTQICVARIRIAPAARDDLREVRVYSKAAFGSQVAFSYLEGIRATLHRLRDRPQMGSAEDDLGEGLKGFTHRSHRIYYRVVPDGVLIVRVLHHARDALRALERDQ
jgi:toxin ParE1/3/4